MWPLGGYIGGGALLLGLLGGWTIRDWKADADMARLGQQAQQARDREQARYDTMASRYEDQRARIEPAKETTRERIKEIYRDVPAAPAVCIPPDDALSLLDKAVEAVNSTASTGQFGRSMPITPEKARPVR